MNLGYEWGMSEKIYKEYSCRVISNRPITPTVFEIAFDPNETLNFKAGQFISIIVPGAGPKGRDLRRAYSIASAPEKKYPELCVKLVKGGPGTNYLHQLKAGDSFRGVAPYGDFVFKTPADKSAVFLATGTGIAPFRSMVQSTAYRTSRPKSAILLLGVREENELLYVQELSQEPGLRFVSAVSRPQDPSFNFKGRVTDYLRAHSSEVDWANSDFYLCGGGAMIDEIKKILGEQGVQKPQIHQEVYYKTPKEDLAAPSA